MHTQSRRNCLRSIFWLLIFLIGFLPVILNLFKSPQTAQDKIDFKKWESLKPQLWAEDVPGVTKRLDAKPEEKVIALTLDACGSDGDGYDRELIEFLILENIPATLFINRRWIDKNPGVFKFLSGNSLFEIANHGDLHKPASVNGKSVYGIQGTKSVKELYGEIENNARKIFGLTGKRPRYYRSGTAYYDEVAVAFAMSLGQTVVGFSVLGDRGATYSEEEVAHALNQAEDGDIIILHMNHPEKETYEGVRRAVPELKAKGYRFVKLSEYGLIP